MLCQLHQWESRLPKHPEALCVTCVLHSEIVNFLFFLAVYANFRLFFACKSLSLLFNITHLAESRRASCLRLRRLRLPRRVYLKRCAKPRDSTMFNRKPFRFTSRAILRQVFRVHFKPVIGSPAVASFNNLSSAFKILGCFFRPEDVLLLHDEFLMVVSCSNVQFLDDLEQSLFGLIPLSLLIVMCHSTLFILPERQQNVFCFSRSTPQATRLIAWCCWAVFPYGCFAQLLQVHLCIFRLVFFFIVLVLFRFFSRQDYHISKCSTYFWTNPKCIHHRFG